MKNTKEIKAILTAIHCINFTSEHKDNDIFNLIEYAFRRCFDGTGNIAILACIGQTKESIMPVVQELLKQETNYTQFIKNNKGE